MKKLEIVDVKLDKIVGGGQALGQLPDGRKLFVWGGLPGEVVSVQITKKKSSFAEGVAIDVVEPSPERIEPKDPDSYLSTSPWQIMNFKAEQRYKINLIKEAFELHNINLPDGIEIYSDGRECNYRNKVEFSWYGDTISGVETLNLAFFRRGSKGKVIVDDSALLPPEIMDLARKIRDELQRIGVSARQLKTLLIRSDAKGNCVWQLYVKDHNFNHKSLLHHLSGCEGSTFTDGEVIYSDQRSPASVITERLASTGNIVLEDTILGVPFRYATEGFFQVNIPVYEQALRDMREWVSGNSPATTPPSFSSGSLSANYSSVLLRFAGKANPSEKEVSSDWSVEAEGKRVATDGATPALEEISKRDFSKEGVDPLTGPAPSDLRANSEGIRDDGSERRSKKKVLDLYSGVGSIGLTIGGPGVTLVEINKHAVREMKRNIKELGVEATPILAASEDALEYITGDKIIIVDPPRAGLHKNVVERLLEVEPPRIIYLSCNPVTQARDIELLSSHYTIKFYKGYNFFPRTPHIEGLAILDLK